MMDFREEKQNEIIEKALSSPRCSISAAVRLGKTYCMLICAQKFKKVLVSYPNLPIKQSWLDDAEKFNIDISHITFTTNISLENYDLKEYDCVICDEYDTLSISNLEFLQQNLPDNLKLFSGTPPEKGSDKRFISENIAPTVYEILIDETIGKTSKDYKITVHLLDASKTILPLSKGRSWSEIKKIKWLESRYEKSRNWNDMLQIINAIKQSKTKMDYLQKMVKSNEREIIFVETKKQCSDLGLPTYHSGIEDADLDLEGFQRGLIDKLVTINQLKAGITFKNLKRAILLHTYSNYSKAQQKLARVLTYSEEGDVADLHVLCIKDSYDFKWVKKSLEHFDQSKITWKHEII